MTTRRWISLTLFCLVGAAAVTGLVLTRSQEGRVEQAPKGAAGPSSAPAPKERLVDETPLLTARRLIPLAVTVEEKQFVHQAERVATHEVDLAFTDALRQAHENPPAPTPECQALLTTRSAQEATVEAGTRHVADLTRLLAEASTRDKAALEDQLEVAKAELELNQDERDQTTEALERLGGDPQGRIQRLKAAHAAADAVRPEAGVPASTLYQPGSFLAKLSQFSQDTAKLKQVRLAEKEAREKYQTMVSRRVTFAQRVAKEGEGREIAKRRAAGFSRAQKATDGPSRDQAKSTLQELQHYMSDQRRLADFGRRIQDQEELTEVYGSWISLAQGLRRSSLHALLLEVLWILAVVLAVMLAEFYFEHLFLRLAKGQNRVGRMLKVVKFATQALGLLAMAFLVFGLPSQLATTFGLAGAGLTVAMKDFIVAFFGWFVLVGRNGIHVGDWVEIKGVGGEVVEIGLLRTLIMETGNWNDASHPTGRIASFVNSFAMEGHFFNFSTSGQWMWDELRLMAPKDGDPYPFIEAVRSLVEKETEANAKLAEQEWRQAKRKPRAQGFTAQPGINVVPTPGGIELRVRYITRAYERHDTQRHLNQALLELLHGKPKE